MASGFEDAPKSQIISGKTLAVAVEGVTIALLFGAFFLFFASNDNMPGGPDDDDFWDDFFNPPWAPG